MAGKVEIALHATLDLRKQAMADPAEWQKAVQQSQKSAGPQWRTHNSSAMPRSLVMAEVERQELISPAPEGGQDQRMMAAEVDRAALLLAEHSCSIPWRHCLTVSLSRTEFLEALPVLADAAAKRIPPPVAMAERPDQAALHMAEQFSPQKP